MCHCVTAEDATLSRHSGIEIEQLSLQNRLSTNHSGEVRMCVHIHTVTYVQSYIHVTFILVKYVCAYIYTQLRTFSHTYMLHSFWRSTYVRTYTHSYVRSIVHTSYITFFLNVLLVLLFRVHCFFLNCIMSVGIMAVVWQYSMLVSIDAVAPCWVQLVLGRAIDIVALC